ncbi:MAG: LLM class flavin-dependent oxidoreductase [Candidatus Bipolaricaulia bacterium]
MKVGLAFDGTLSTPEMVEIVRLVEQTGLDSIWMAEDFFYRDSVSTASAFMAHTQRIQVVPFFTAYTRHPVISAMTLAALDEGAGRERLMMALGTGSPLSLRQMGINRERPLTRMREYVEIVRALLDGQRLRYDGTGYRIDGVQLDFKPARPRIPIYLAAMRPRMIELGGQIADGLLLSAGASAPYVRAAADRARRSAQAAGRSQDEVAMASFLIACVTTTVDDDVLEETRLTMGYLLRNPGFKEIIKQTGVSVDQPAFETAYQARDQERIKHMVTSEMLDAFAIVGSSEHYHKRLDEFQQAGLDHAVLLPVGDANAHKAVVEVAEAWR